jgi:hypothetical protein
VTKIKRLSVLFISAMALVAVALVGLAADPNAPAAQAAWTPNCNGYAEVKVGSKKIHVPIYTTSTTTRNCIVGHPTSGTHVKAVQNAAKSCYSQNLGQAGVDGITGTYFIKAVKGVQTAVGTKQDGIYGPNTHNGASGNPAVSGMKFYPSCLRDNILA